MKVEVELVYPPNRTKVIAIDVADDLVGSELEEAVDNIMSEFVAENDDDCWIGWNFPVGVV